MTAEGNPHKTAYSELLKDPRWQKKRLEIFERDGWACKICGDSESTLHVHHSKYLVGKKPWEYPNDLLVTLCESCHDQETELYPEFLWHLQDALEYAGYFSHDIEMLSHIVAQSSCMPHGVTVALQAVLYVISHEDTHKALWDLYFDAIKPKVQNGVAAS